MINIFKLFVFFFSLLFSNNRVDGILAVVDENIVVVGTAHRDNYLDGEMSACYWFNGELNYLVKQGDVPAGIDDWYWSDAKGIHIE